MFALAGSAPEGPGVAISLLWLVLIFSCVVVHELAHCFVGRPRGAVVHEIVLLPIGGVSKLEHLPETPSDELAMAIAGPAASVGSPRLPAPPRCWRTSPAADRTLRWIAARRSLLVQPDHCGVQPVARVPPRRWAGVSRLLERRYDLERATRLAARIGRGVAVVLILSGVLFDLWLAIIGVFVYFGASAEEVATIVHVRLGGQRVSDAMLLDPVTVAPTTSADELRALLRRSAQRAFPIVGASGYEGMVEARAIEHSAPQECAIELASAPRRELPPRTAWRTTSRSWRAPRRAHSR